MANIGILWQKQVVTLNQQVTGSIPVRLTRKQLESPYSEKTKWGLYCFGHGVTLAVSLCGSLTSSKVSGFGLLTRILLISIVANAIRCRIGISLRPPQCSKNRPRQKLVCEKPTTVTIHFKSPP